MKAKLFICHHPGSLSLYKGLIQVVKRYDKNTKIILLKVNHPYFAKLNFEPYERYFDEIIEFDFIHYKKNFLNGLWEILVFQKKLKKIIATHLRNFQTIDLFLSDSAWLSVNILLYNLSKLGNIRNIIKFTSPKIECSQTETDKIKTFLCILYSLPLKCYKIKVISTLGGQFVGFVYTENTPGAFVKIISPIADSINSLDELKGNILPYPVTSEYCPVAKKDMIIIFGNKGIFQNIAEYFPSYETYVKKLTALFKTIENKYSDCRLYYKPHPADKEQIMPGIDIKKYSLFNNTVNAPELFDMYRARIRAVYAFSSGSVTFGSFFGIPSYTFYQYLCNQAGIKRIDRLFINHTKFLFHVANLNDVGKIDDLKCPVIDSKNLEKTYRQVLNV